MSAAKTAQRAAVRLLERLGAKPLRPPGSGDHPALAWRRAGLLAITGQIDGPGLVCPAALASAADGAMLALRSIVPDPAVLPQNGAVLLGERARLLGLGRQGRVSSNGSCRLIDTADGRIALNLARADDWDLLPILFADEGVQDWIAAERVAVRYATSDLLQRGIALGLPIARDEPIALPASPYRIAGGLTEKMPLERPPLVLDFSALWAGPLAGSLLALLGAEVIKVESSRRLDGARQGHGGFYDLLNADKSSVVIDFADAQQFRRVLALVERADIVIESSRPRALQQLGVDRERFVARGGVWVGITGHDDLDRVGFGDDAAVAGGLAAIMARGWGTPLFAGDAISDPLTGIYAALAAATYWREGRSGLIRLSLARSLAYAAGEHVANGGELEEWQRLADYDAAEHYPLRIAAGRSARPGTDNHLLD